VADIYEEVNQGGDGSTSRWVNIYEEVDQREGDSCTSRWWISTGKWIKEETALR
jgi:hypothetical protein